MVATAHVNALEEALGQWPLPGHAPVVEDKQRLSSTQERDLIRLYRRVTGDTSESFTYTDEFEILYEAFIARTGIGMDRNELWRTLSNIRKRGGLPRKRRNH